MKSFYLRLLKIAKYLVVYLCGDLGFSFCFNYFPFFSEDVHLYFLFINEHALLI